VDAILDGSIKDAEFHTIPVSGFEVPVSLPGVEQKLLDPHSTWANPADYDEAEKKLASMYVNNFKKYEGVGSVDYTKFGPQIK
jgi:phosphoenolpyruvate carboxykinase (ATP)